MNEIHTSVLLDEDCLSLRYELGRNLAQKGVVKLCVIRYLHRASTSGQWSSILF
jgi:hypothetical protein